MGVLPEKERVHIASARELPVDRPKAMTARGATVLGVGSMIGAGIIALLGDAGAVAGGAVWISFLIGGIVAALLGYVCVKLGARYPSSGGLITYLVEGFGNGRLVGIAVLAVISIPSGSGGEIREARSKPTQAR
jgi:amino acid transporter